MEMEYKRDDERRRFTVVSRGVASMTDILTSLDRQREEGAWTYALLHDGRALTGVDMDAHDIRCLLDRVGLLNRQHGPQGPVAIVATDATTYGMARMYSILAEAENLVTNVFRSVAEAEAWLDGLDPKR